MERSELARVRTTVARDAMKRGGLGHGSVRFIPKRGATLRPIVTLSKRAMLMSRSGPVSVCMHTICLCGSPSCFHPFPACHAFLWRSECLPTARPSVSPATKRLSRTHALSASSLLCSFVLHPSMNPSARSLKSSATRPGRTLPPQERLSGGMARYSHA